MTKNILLLQNLEAESLPSTRETWTSWSKSSEGHKGDEGTGPLATRGEAERAWAVEPGKEKALQNLINVFKYVMGRE